MRFAIDFIRLPSVAFTFNESAPLCKMNTESLEQQLDSFDPARAARRWRLCAGRGGQIALPTPARDVNLHAHTFFSYNAYGYSPSKFAWLARKAGLAVAGIVDFDVLDALEEFLEAGRLVGLKTCVSLESRVFVPEFATRVINSPGEPGIAYHMGVGFTRAVQHPFLARDARRRRAAHPRHGGPRQHVHAAGRAGLRAGRGAADAEGQRHRAPPLRGLSSARRRRSFPTPRSAPRTGRRNSAMPRPPGAKLQNLIRAKTMKKGGVGYVQPGKGSFPLMADMNRFVLECGAIPTLAWLDGTTDGEQASRNCSRSRIATGAAALNIIPDRNYTPGVKDQKLKNLYDVVALAEKHHFPVIVGTEMNSPGNKFVDSFETAELEPLVPVFLRGAHIVYAHSVLQRQSGLGYLSRGRRRRSPTSPTKNEFFEKLGRELQPASEDRLAA